MTDKKVVTRFAPSPTGFMHIGGVRTALFAYLFAKKNNGTFILRIEDTDKEREVPGSIEHIQESLKWLGIDWDYGPDKPGSFGSVIQSQRLPTYIEKAKELLDKGFAYPDPYTKEEVEKFRKQAEEEKRPFLFRDHRPNIVEWDGKMPLRFKVLDIKKYEWDDVVRGRLSAGPEALDDFILIKADGYPTYNLAHIVDDLNMEVTHVMRGDEFISSTPKFLSLYDALGIPYPYLVSLPPIQNDTKTKKLGKRDGAKDILEYRNEGYLPEAMINFLALIGWNPGTEQEIFTKDELIQAFDINKIQKAGGAFNEEKLDWINKEHMKRMSQDDINTAIKNRLDKFDIGEKVPQKAYPIIFDHISKWGDIDNMAREGELDFYFSAPKYPTALLKWKDSEIADAKKHLEWLKDHLLNSPDNIFSNTDSIKNSIFEYATANGRGNVLWPLRVSLSGKEKSPDPFTLIYILGKEETVSRIDFAINNI